MKIRRIDLGGALRASTLALALAIGTTSFAPSAVAQTKAELAKARTLFKEGVSLEAAGDWAGALGKFQEVAKVKTTPQVRFHIARCKEHLGRLTEALGEYRLAEYEAQQSQAKELAEITQAREDLEARIPKLVIQRGEGAESAKIELDGVEFGEAQIGTEVTVDPGPHRIVAKLSGGQFEETVNLAEGEKKEVSLVPPEDFKPKGAGTGEPSGDSGTTTTSQGAVKVDSSGPGALPWIIGGVGVVGLAAGGYFFLQRNKAEDDLNAVCRGDVCPKSKQGLEDDGKRYALLTNVGLGVGVVGIGVATVMLLSGGGGKEKPPASALRINVVPTPQMAGVNVAGRF